MRRASGERIRFLPAHSHEKSVGVPKALEAVALVVARGRSMTIGAQFNLCVAIEEPGIGRAVQMPPVAVARIVTSRTSRRDLKVEPRVAMAIQGH